MSDFGILYSQPVAEWDAPFVDFVRPEWMDQGTCRAYPKSWFYPNARNSPYVGFDPYQRARKVCAACPVRDTCAEYACTNNEQHGMWGGLSPEGRRAVRRGATIARGRQVRSRQKGVL
jgi:WhiB family redox-sensing transcriptional regulator